MKDSKIVALMIGRGGSSLKNKNVLPVLGYPLLHWAAGAAVRSAHIGRYYISSDCQRILSTAGSAGYRPIFRPPELATDTAQSCDAVRHALAEIRRDKEIDILVVQHANVGTVSEEIIDSCIEQLRADETLSAVVPSHEHNEYHPLRAKGVTSEGLLTPFCSYENQVSANRQELPACYFFDHSIWVIRASSVDRHDGQGPWDCMGNRIKPYPTSGCLDVHTLEDLKTTESWILENEIPEPRFDA